MNDNDRMLFGVFSSPVRGDGDGPLFPDFDFVLPPQQQQQQQQIDGAVDFLQNNPGPDADKLRTALALHAVALDEIRALMPTTIAINIGVSDWVDAFKLAQLELPPLNVTYGFPAVQVQQVEVEVEEEVEDVAAVVRTCVMMRCTHV